ncbi:MFS transporter [Paenibacillus sp. VTT E-133280]|jgi:MFS family permease|uniref:MFS transporter n=1 Tax=Paenibacillus odorifer TaxID=189426 RepID=A0A1R0ZK32_9BACL|nr:MULTISPECIES: MFS transporter [Paenibacillus]KAA1183327.1 multidrug efflux MFS transporter [Paenibacillus sp. B2(2019)]MDH6372022.1 DHA1 family multidrug resistance protein-like MFS transporter [Paenibacillus sp. PastF-3]OMD52708.1 MFS transporter [Paenibacillus odorifer]OME72136.1 MFS transporter [Paenibacillus odorifer]OZQ64409.1 MFS transporter [Paenibacillus sp. VTT E-133280]
MRFSWKRNLIVLWVGVFFCSTAYSISIPFLSIFLSDELGVTNHLEIWSGVSFGITFLASALISPYWGSLADKYGRKPMLIRSGFSLAALYLINYFVHDPYVFLIVRVLQGLLAGFVPAAIAMVATNTPEDKTGYALSIMSTAGATGSIIGPLIGGVVSFYTSNRVAFLFSAGIVLVSALIATFFAKEENFDRSAPRSHVSDDIKEARSNRAFMTLLSLAGISTFSVMILEPLIPIHLLDMGIAKSSASLSSGIVFSAVGIATVLMAPQWGRIGSRKGFGMILFIGLIGGGIGNILQFFVTGYVEFAVLRFAYGLFYAGVLPSVNAMIVQVIEPGFRGRAFGLNQAASQLATMAGPIIGGLLGAFIQIRWVFVINGVMLLVAAVLVKTRKLDSQIAAARSAE